MTRPHDICPHGNGIMRCMVACPLCDVEPDAEFANRCEVAAEGGGGEVVRRAECLLDAWERWADEIDGEAA
jgi:hypothetical protein